MVEIRGERKVRLEDIWYLHEEGKSTREITDWMNEKYRTTFRSKKPYYPSLIYETIKKYRRRMKRMNDYEEEYLNVEFIKIDDLSLDNRLKLLKKLIHNI